jgi:hypothetical protein
MLIGTYRDAISFFNKKMATLDMNFLDNSSMVKYGSDLADKYTYIQNQLLVIKDNFTEKWKNSKNELSFDKEQKLIDEQVAYLRASIERLKSDTSISSQKLQQDLYKQIQSLLGSSNWQTMVKEFQRVAGTIGISMDQIRKYLKEDDQSREEWAKNTNEVYDERIKKIKQYETASSFAARASLFNSKEEFELYKKETEFINQIISLYNIREESKTKGSDKNPLLDAIKEEIRLITELTAKYQELRKEGQTDHCHEAFKYCFHFLIAQNFI